MDSLANRYASALLDIALEENKNQQYRDQIKELVDSFSESDELLALLKSSFVSKEEKKSLFNEMLKGIELVKICDFINVIIDNSRERFLLEILREFIAISNAHDNISEGIIYSTTKLSKEEINKITKSIEEKLHKRVNLHNRLDGSLIGGIKVIIDEHVYDGSIKNKLKNLKQQLEKGV